MLVDPIQCLRNGYLNDSSFFLIDQDDSRLTNAWENLWITLCDDDKLLLSNGKLILTGDGVELFLKCASNFPENTGLNREMVGTFSMLVLKKELRIKLGLSQKFIHTILGLADSKDCSDISFGSLEILVNVVKDGQESWSITNPTFDETCQKMDRFLEKWEISEDVKFTGVYTSFEPILPLLELPQCQHFALWTLACCTRMIKSKYLFVSMTWAR